MSSSAGLSNITVHAYGGEQDVSGDAAARGYVIGIDLGGTKILAGIAGADGHILKVREELTQHGAGVPVLTQMAALISALVADAGARPGELHNVVIGIPSAVDPVTGLASLSPNLALPADRSLAELISPLVDCPVSVENDVNLAAYAEATAGAGRGEGSLAFVSFGTGVGMGIVVGGELWRGESGRAGEIGYLPVGAAPHDAAPLSENGLYEDAVGSRGIRQSFVKDGNTVANLFALSRSGDEDARAAMDVIAKNASVGIAAVHALLDPAVTVIGGGIGCQDDFFQLLKKHLVPLLPFDCRLEPSRFGPQAGMIGAVMMAVTCFAKTPDQQRISAGG